MGKKSFVVNDLRILKGSYPCIIKIKNFGTDVVAKTEYFKPLNTYIHPLIFINIFKFLWLSHCVKIIIIITVDLYLCF